ncbi:ankyrin repeat domain-containing protein [Rodentibacter pneumotropicus]|uniref:ankyrin repeat domain-containing protein n=1 Tax=Rodentibacter pneumotropicus TaxID=758 RepID=UPI0021177B15|nr:ankyrin repeat domain-containing protein [Rodentibacter pneumotropicus]
MMKNNLDKETQRVLNRYQELYDSDLSLQVISASSEGDISLLKTLFDEKKLDIFAVTSDKWNWLHQILVLCTTYIPPKMSVEFFIKNGVDINAQDIYGMTPLHYAMRGKNVDAAIALLNAGADPNIPNIDNVTPLSLIGYLPNRLDILELMLEKGANVNHLINEGETILESYIPSEDEPYLLPIYNLMKKYA